ncbi:transcriptional regulator NrdR [Chlamydiia bacterium]|nr:transcriptional regulator NrdR [Chlamydiia bacterium]
MRCPYCKHKETKVTDSRETSEANAVRRRRECLVCLKRFTTYELIEYPSIQVKKRDDTFQDFKKEKLVSGLLKATKHTRISRIQVQGIVNKIVDCTSKMPDQVVRSKDIGDMVMIELKSLDSIAYIRFACEYIRFKDYEELVDHVTGLSETKLIKKY